MARLELDLSHWPVVVTMVPPGTLLDQEIRDHNQLYLDTVLTRAEPFVTVTDLRRGAVLTASQRRIITSFMDENRARLLPYCVGAAQVFESAIMRGMLTAILWVTKPPWETRVFATLNEAVEWGDAKVRAHRAPMRAQAGR